MPISNRSKARIALPSEADVESCSGLPIWAALLWAAAAACYLLVIRLSFGCAGTA